MNLHEYQAKQLFREYGLPVSKGIAVDSAEEAAKLAGQIGVLRASAEAAEKKTQQLELELQGKLTALQEQEDCFKSDLGAREQLLVQLRLLGEPPASAREQQPRLRPVRRRDATTDGRREARWQLDSH